MRQNHEDQQSIVLIGSIVAALQSLVDMLSDHPESMLVASFLLAWIYVQSPGNGEQPRR